MHRAAAAGAGAAKTADVVIIGAGVIGCTLALELSRSAAWRGRKIVVLDSNPGPGVGTTSYSSGIIRTFYSVPETTRIAWESYHRWAHWGDYLGVKDPRGMASMRHVPALLMRSPNSAGFLDGFAAQAKKFGIGVTELSHEAAAARGALAGLDITHSYNPQRVDDPSFGTPVAGQRVDGALLVPDTGYVSDPQLATKNAQFAAEAAGVAFAFGSTVSAIRQAAGRVTGVALRDGRTIDTRLVVNAAGPYSCVITEMAFPRASAGKTTPANDMTLTTRPLRAECAVVDAPPGVDLDKHGVVGMDFDVGVYYRPEFGNRLLIGGLDLPCDTMEYEDPHRLAEMNTNLGEQWKCHIYRMALRMTALGIPSGARVRGVVSTYDLSDDWTPIVDGSALAGYYMSIGTSGNCFKVAPLLGQLLTAVMDGRSTIPLSATNGGDISATCFSRFRKPFSVSAGVLG